MTSSARRVDGRKHVGPPLWAPAIMYVVLSLSAVLATVDNGLHFPSPWDAPEVISRYFALRSKHGALAFAMLQFGAAIPLGIYTASVASRYRFLGLTAAGPTIASFGGFVTAGMMLTTASVQWSMIGDGVANDPNLAQAFYRLTFALGGPGFSVPFGVLVLGVALAGGLSRLLPRWLLWSGLGIGIIGELSWLALICPAAFPLVPVTRFLGFVWLIAVAFQLPTIRPYSNDVGQA